MQLHQSAIQISLCMAPESIPAVEAKYRKSNFIELLPQAKNGTPIIEIITNIMPDKQGSLTDGTGKLNHRIIFAKSYHDTTIGTMELARKTRDYLLKLSFSVYPMDILSISVGIEKNRLCDVFVIRAYFEDEAPDFSGLFKAVGSTARYADADYSPTDYIIEQEAEQTYTAAELDRYDKVMEKQKEALQNASEELPFLNSLSEYTSVDQLMQKGKMPIYSLREKQQASLKILSPYSEFTKVFYEIINYLSGVEKDAYVNVLKYSGPDRKGRIDTFMRMAEDKIIKKRFVDTKRLPLEDLSVMLSEVRKALFGLYIIQDLIDDPAITDIKVTNSESIRVRIRGRGYMSDLAFNGRSDYIRFINTLAYSNGINLFVPSQTFTDTHYEDFILRFTITAPYLTADENPVIHIRKISRKKLLGNDLIAAGMFDQKVMQYLVDCGRHSRGVVFAGPPGSGKTVLLNWFLEEGYEDTAEILVVQESDELFSNKKGIIFEHVVDNPAGEEQACNLEELGKMALVSGCNVFVIGEAKGAEICSAITLSNSGCRTAITIHSPSAKETVDKMADLAVRGYADSHEQAKTMLKSFQTIVYVRDFHIEEITEILGYDEEKKDMIYRPIYKRDRQQTITMEGTPVRNFL